MPSEEAWSAFLTVELDEARETIARLERERDEARGVRDHYIQQYERAVDLLKEADAARADARETIARLERELDEARRERDKYRDLQRPSSIAKERDEARADAARMRDLVESAQWRWDDEFSYWFCADCGADSNTPAEDEPAFDLHKDHCRYRAALTPDDGWLARKIEEAVEPYRTAERELSAAYVRLRMMIPGALDTPHGPTGEQVWETTESALRALLGGTPTKEGE